MGPHHGDTSLVPDVLARAAHERLTSSYQSEKPLPPPPLLLPVVMAPARAAAMVWEGACCQPAPSGAMLRQVLRYHETVGNPGAQPQRARPTTASVSPPSQLMACMVALIHRLTQARDELSRNNIT